MQQQAKPFPKKKAVALYIVRTCGYWHGECLFMYRESAARLFLAKGEQMTTPFAHTANTMEKRERKKEGR
ncbi:hypothetical protein AV540_06200 [Brevibacillus parabrevis]|nr:hypothetical protein AV540_06200 [Brevibacillus parabrevis]